MCGALSGLQITAVDARSYLRATAVVGIEDWRAGSIDTFEASGTGPLLKVFVCGTFMMGCHVEWSCKKWPGGPVSSQERFNSK